MHLIKPLASTKSIEWVKDIFIKEMVKVLIVWQHSHVVP
jgi:hypothetical protein